MDCVRSLLLIDAQQPLPNFVPDATLLNLGDLDDSARHAARDQAQQLISAGHRLYLHVHEIQTQQVRDDLLACLVEGVYGVSVPGLISVNQLKYVDSFLEEAERNAGIPEGLTAIGVWIDSAKGLILANEIAGTSSRLTWIGVDEGTLASEIGVDADPESEPLEYAWYTVVFAAQAHDLPAINGAVLDVDTESEVDAAKLARRAGLRGMLTRYENAAPRFNEIFPEPPSETDAESEHAHTG